ncbi:MAG: hypothetical protein E7282_02220 [Lachnospiraceae bacterium]|nr:hypothetical protein [Lachnospiraceae bacterium]
MMENMYMKKGLAIFLCLIIGIGFIKNGALSQMQKICDYVKQDPKKLDDAISMTTIQSDFSNNLFARSQLIDFNGQLLDGLQMNDFYYHSSGFIVTEGDYIMTPHKYTSTDYEVEQIANFYDFLSENKIGLLYVNAPSKYTDDSVWDKYGIKAYGNKNTDYFLNRIEQLGIPTIDLRKNMEEEKIDVHDLFYRTDHHWTVPAGLWATQIIANGLNEYCGHSIDVSIYDKDNYEFITWKNCWLGEQGKKASAALVGLDDYTKVTPKFETSYIFKTANGNVEGDFSKFINEDVYNTENDVYMNTSWHYSYQRINCVNQNVEHGKILLLCDSYGHVTEPFLSLGVHEVDSLILRNYDTSKFDLRDYIIKNKYDTVIVCYAQFMIGAHDNVSNANYRMFTFR